MTDESVPHVAGTRPGMGERLDEAYRRAHDPEARERALEANAAAVAAIRGQGDSDIVARAEALLAPITPGPWTRDRSTPTISAEKGGLTFRVAEYRHVNDGPFIAASPDLVRGLLDLVAERDAQIKRLKASKGRRQTERRAK